eukprot:TRINITY_DN2214_c0_g1_i2.p1 TRINITY_DN2214_c0_g1~~TRINITY_DN2214_c0_g1_i2.p1  ORF type:complete len:365 (-),score=43.76 TRINITY_DN2214_c0_g1_i2:313-1407(-)
MDKVQQPKASPLSYSVFLPVYSSQDIGIYDSSVTTVVIFVHGLLGNANTYFCQGMKALEGRKHTVVVTPWFGGTSITGTYWNSSNSVGPMISTYWQGGHWCVGGDNAPNPAQYTTSFDCLDILLQKFDNKIFPNLKQIVLNGFSAGAQLVSRYAFFSPLQAKFPVRVIAADASSYMYFDSRRPISSCVPLNPTPTNWSCPQFQTPKNTQDCDTFNNYKFGLNDLEDSNSLYIQDLNDQQVQQLIKDYLSKDVRWIFGDGDICNCGTNDYDNPKACFHPDCDSNNHCCDSYPDSKNSNALDVGCEVMYQGSNRLQRGLNFMSYLMTFYKNYKPTYSFFHGGHDDFSFFLSDPFLSWCDQNTTFIS